MDKVVYLFYVNGDETEGEIPVDRKPELVRVIEEATDVSRTESILPAAVEDKSIHIHVPASTTVPIQTDGSEEIGTQTVIYDWSDQTDILGLSHEEPSPPKKQNLPVFVKPAILRRKVSTSQQEIHPEKKRKVEDSLTCNTCGAQFLEECDLLIHIRIHAGKKPYTCSVCGNGYDKSKVLLEHLKIHSKTETFKCHVCSDEFNDSKLLLEHLRKHTAVKPYSCKYCDEEFAESSFFYEHIKTHIGEVKPYPCYFCGREFRFKSPLLKHLKTHTGEKPHKCDECGKGFVDYGNLQNHIRTHTGEKPFQCSTCGKRFCESGQLRVHMRIHTGEKPYICNICNTPFRKSGHLQHHLRTHTGEKPYSCHICDKSFSQGYGLKRHIRIHTGEKPHKCEDCGKGFRQSGTLLKHRTIHAKEKQKTSSFEAEEGLQENLETNKCDSSVATDGGAYKSKKLKTKKKKKKVFETKTVDELIQSGEVTTVTVTNEDGNEEVRIVLNSTENETVDDLTTQILEFVAEAHTYSKPAGTETVVVPAETGQAEKLTDPETQIIDKPEETVEGGTSVEIVVTHAEEKTATPTNDKTPDTSTNDKTPDTPTNDKTMETPVEDRTPETHADGKSQEIPVSDETSETGTQSIPEDVHVVEISAAEETEPPKTLSDSCDKPSET